MIKGDPARSSQPNTPSQIASPDCTGPERYTTAIALVRLKDVGITDIDFDKTQITRIASEPIGGGKFRQVHRVLFTEHSGKQIQVITVNDASFEECSESGADVYVVGPNLDAKTGVDLGPH